jgi:hypothetical protein
MAGSALSMAAKLASVSSGVAESRPGEFDRN